MSDIRENEYIDTQILALRSKYHEIQSENQPVGNEIQIGTDRVALYKADLFGGACSIMLPETMTDMGAADREVIYQNRNRPQIIKADRESGAAITFSMFPQTGEEEQRHVSEQMAVIRNDMKKIWKQNVFYDIGEVVAENTPVAWMDFKHTVLMEIFTVSFLCFRRRHGQYWETFIAVSQYMISGNHWY